MLRKSLKVAQQMRPLGIGLFESTRIARSRMTHDAASNTVRWHLWKLHKQSATLSVHLKDRDMIKYVQPVPGIWAIN